MYEINYDNIEIQKQFMELLSKKCQDYNSGISNSIRTEIAESIMKSTFYTVNLYFKSIIIQEKDLESISMPNIFLADEKGRKIAEKEFQKAKQLYKFVQKSKIYNSNYSYNSTLSKDGLGIFFETYNSTYRAHETPASIDYQLCNPVVELTGVEYIKKYLENLYIENQFCKNFDDKNITNLLFGYSEEYEELLINIFQQVLVCAIGCILLRKDIRNLSLSQDDIVNLHNQLLLYDINELELIINQAVEEIMLFLNIKSKKIQSYIRLSTLEIISDINFALKNNSLDKVFVESIDSNSVQKNEFISSPKMPDEDYREFIEELRSCRYLSDKIAMIKEKIKSFDDLEELFLDGELSEKVINEITKNLQKVEIEELQKRKEIRELQNQIKNG